MSRQPIPDLAEVRQHFSQAIMELEYPPGKELAARFAQEWRRGYG
jgi:hypothetical protein